MNKSVGLMPWARVAVVAIQLCGLAAQGLAGDDPVLRDVSIAPDDRVLVLAPHPDDEVIGCGGIIQRARTLGRPVRIVFLTYGDNNQWSFAVYRKHPVVFPWAVRRMGEIRRGEALDADRLLGITARDLVFLGYPDFGTLSIWSRHWGKEPPYRSILTRASAVPYADAFRPDAPYRGEEVLSDLKNIIRQFRPTKIFLPHPADHHPDHQALYLFATVALWELAGETQTAVMPYLVHFRNWPEPRGYRNDLFAVPPKALSETVSWMSFPLQPAEIDRKRAALEMHKTQFEYSGKYLMSFARRTELFGDCVPIRFVPSVASPGLEVDRPADAAASELHPFLEDQERDVYVGLERRELRLAENALVIGIRLSRPLTEAASVSLHAFGYRQDRPFALMPKLHVEIGPHFHQALDQSRPLPAATYSVERTATELIVRIPLAVLGEPDRILTSARTHAAEIPLDWTAWRVVNIVSPANDRKEGPHAAGTQVPQP